MTKLCLILHLRLNKTPPNIIFKKKEKGGINLQTMVQQSELDLDLVKTILSEYRISNADITLRLLFLVNWYKIESRIKFPDVTLQPMNLLTLLKGTEPTSLASTSSTRLIRSVLRSLTLSARFRTRCPSLPTTSGITMVRGLKY